MRAVNAFVRRDLLVRFLDAAKSFRPRALLGNLEMTTATLRPPYEDVRAHYDLSNEFFRLFLGPTMMYTCAYFERPEMTHEEAQIAKIDLLFSKGDIRPGMRLVDVGCGWGTTIIHAVEKYGVKGIGLTLSEEQARYCRERAPHLEGKAEFRVQGWEEFTEPVDRIVCICALEHFRVEKYGAFFDMCHRLLPAQAPFLLQAIVYPEESAQEEKGIRWTEEDIAFARFIQRKIFPGGQVRTQSLLSKYGTASHLKTTSVQSLQPHYARTLDCWAGNLEANRQRAIAVTSQETYDMYRHYLTGCADRYRCGKLDVVQIKFENEK
jgi:cyclopropane-fatty-acyl-phospholipid synthase